MELEKKIKNLSQTLKDKIFFLYENSQMKISNDNKFDLIKSFIIKPNSLFN